MEALGTRVVLAPGASGMALLAIAAGVALGSVSGLVPGLHVNNLALLLAAAAPAIPGPPHLVGAAMIAAGVVHSFLDVVPALALGVPDPSMAAVALPGHRLVLGGRGHEALRLSAVGSAAAVALALPLALPVTAVMRAAYPVLREHLPLVLAGVEVLLLAGERTGRARLGSALAFATSGLLGVAALDWLAPSGPLPTGDALAPLFAGLFGAPVLVDAARGGGVPPQRGAGVAIDRAETAVAALAGTVAGAAVGYVPGVSSAIASVLALTSLPAEGDRAYLVATSGANTGNAIFALFALVALGSPRTGVLVAFERASLPLNLPLLLLAAVAGAAVGAVLVVVAGERYLRLVGRVDATRLSLAVLGLLVCLSALFAGLLGVGIFAAAAVVGRLPVRFRSRRVHLMGVLMVPIAL
ncbi:MAG: tripartite tricarboxylate transporter permease [Halobacteriaceae archaeon]